MQKSIDSLAPPTHTISVSALRELLQASDDHAAGLIDVRTAAEFESHHVAGARSLPLGELKVETLHATMDRVTADRPLYVMCGSGQRSRKAVAWLREHGCGQPVNVEGGLLAWEAAGFPVERGSRQTVSLERQVRIAAWGRALSSPALLTPAAWAWC